MSMKNLSDKDYAYLAKEALFGFRMEALSDPADLLCELYPNISLAMKRKLKKSDIDPKQLSESIKKKLIEIINSKKFDDVLLAYCVCEAEDIKDSCA